jgi:hypothetical protein
MRADNRHKENLTMRSRHDYVTFLEHRQPEKSVRVEGARHPEFPLERLCWHLHEPFQLSFGRNAQQHFRVREDVEAVASHHGLSLRAETEESIDAAIVILKDLYGPNLRVGPPTIRYHKGNLLEQPWMGLRVSCAPQHLDAVNADLIDREATVSGCQVEPAQCVLEARAPLATLLGYRSDLESLTEGSGRHAMWLSHYAPIETPPPDGQAA